MKVLRWLFLWCLVVATTSQVRATMSPLGSEMTKMTATTAQTNVAVVEAKVVADTAKTIALGVPIDAKIPNATVVDDFSRNQSDLSQMTTRTQLSATRPTPTLGVPIDAKIPNVAIVGNSEETATVTITSTTAANISKTAKVRGALKMPLMAGATICATTVRRQTTGADELLL